MWLASHKGDTLSHGSISFMIGMIFNGNIIPNYLKEKIRLA
jgi:hypothetical protein